MMVQYQMFCEHLSTAGHQENVVTLELKDRSVLKVKMTVWVGDLDSCFEASHTLEGLKTGQVSERWYSTEIEMQHYCGKSGTKQNILNQLCCEDIFGIQMDLFCRSIFCVVHTPYWFVFFLGIQFGVIFFLFFCLVFVCLFILVWCLIRPTSKCKSLSGGARYESDQPLFEARLSNWIGGLSMH